MADSYLMLLASLPRLPYFSAPAPLPINAIKLQQRLRWLAPHHRQRLGQLTALLSWGQQDGAQSGWEQPGWEQPRSDAELIAAAEILLRQLDSPTLQSALRYRLELRTIVAALRLRQRGDGPPTPQQPWGFGRFGQRLRHHWQEPGLGVERSFPWVLEARDRLASADAKGLERLLLEAIWRQHSRLAAHHAFDFEAVALYVLRWQLVERWQRYRAAAAAARFNALVAAALPEIAATDPPH